MRVRSLEPGLFRLLRPLVPGEAARTSLDIIAEHQRTGRTISLGKLADHARCDERNARIHLKSIEDAIDEKLAQLRLPVEFEYTKRGPGRQIPIDYRAVLHRQWGHSEKFLLGFTTFGPDAAPDVDLCIYRRGSEARSYACGGVELALPVSGLLQARGVRVNHLHQIEDIWLAQRPAIVICDTEQAQALDRPMFVDARPEPARVEQSTGRALRYEDLLVTRFMNSSSPPQPILVIEYRDDFAPLGMKCLLLRNEGAKAVWHQLQLWDDVLPPAQYQIKIRFELIDRKNDLNNLGDPQVIRPYHFDLPSPEEPVLMMPPAREGPSTPKRRRAKGGSGASLKSTT
ncbi:MAG: hypothetical protein FJW39_07980 [Acidobacteria bacterium]|nr:hypothetical protein [Acidobacteriota bacterium]